MVAAGVDFLLNFVSATSFDSTTPQTVVDDGRDVLFGDTGNDWLVGGTNQDVLFGGYGNDLLQADDNLDSTKVTATVTYTSLCALTTSFSSSGHEADKLCDELYDIQCGGRALPLVQPDTRPRRVGRVGHRRRRLRVHRRRGGDADPLRAGAEAGLRPARERHRRPARLRRDVRRHRLRRRRPRRADREHRLRPALRLGGRVQHVPLPVGGLAAARPSTTTRTPRLVQFLLDLGLSARRRPDAARTSPPATTS